MATNPGVWKIYYTKEGENQQEVVHIHTAGPKTYFRIWMTDDGPETDWGWGLPQGAEKIYDWSDDDSND